MSKGAGGEEEEERRKPMVFHLSLSPPHRFPLLLEMDSDPKMLS
jgi:hypothetical protein